MRRIADNIPVEALLSEAIKEIMKPLVRELIHEVMAEREADEKAEADCREVRLSRKELCERWHITLGTLRNYINQGRIHPIHIGRRVLFSLKDVLDAESKGIAKFRRCA